MSTYSERMEPKARQIADGERLSLLIDEAGFGKSEFGFALGDLLGEKISPDKVSRWISGELSFESVYLREAMCDVLGCTLDDLSGNDAVERSLEKLQSVETKLRNTIRKARDDLTTAQADKTTSRSLDAMTRLLPHANRALKVIGETVKLVQEVLHAEKNSKLKTWAAILLGAALIATGATGCAKKKIALVPVAQITAGSGMTKGNGGK